MHSAARRAAKAARPSPQRAQAPPFWPARTKADGRARRRDDRCRPRASLPSPTLPRIPALPPVEARDRARDDRPRAPVWTARPFQLPGSAAPLRGGSGSTCRFRLDPRPAAPRLVQAPGPGPRRAAGRRGGATPARSAADGSLALVLERVHVVVGKAEMMPDLVDHDVRHELLEADARGLPLSDDRAAIERHSFG